MRKWFLLLPALAVGLFLVGCRYSTRSGLPEHIRTVVVKTVRNDDTFYKGVEAKLTRSIIERVNLDPNVRVVNSGGNAEIAVSITDIKKSVYTETKEDRPASVRLTIKTRIEFYDNVEDRTILDIPLSSSQASTTAGLYEVSRGELESNAEDAAVNELAKEIVRRTIGMW